MDGRPYIRCLGQPALFSTTGEPIRIRTKKHLALLVYLAVEGRRAHRRDRLAELFWPNVPTAEARHSLATALSILRPRLGPGAIEATRDHVLLTEGRVGLDLDRLLAGEVVATETHDALPVAGFLEGFEIPDAAEFGLWKDSQRARLLPAIRAALVQLIDRCRRTGDSRQIESLADTMLALDDLSEEAVRAKMEARAFAGDRLTALRIFEEWRVRLGEAVGAQPSELVEGMAARLRRRGWESIGPTNAPTVRTEQWRDRPFVGRSREFRLLYEAWESTRRGKPAHVLVLGDSGVGKTTLVDRLTTAAGLEGAVSSRAQGYDLEQEISYATLSNLVHGLLDRPGVSGTPPEALAEVALTIKEVRRKFPTIPIVEESHGEAGRIRLTEGVFQMLVTIAEEHPVILVVDDLHLCDDASLSVLHVIAHRLTTQPIMLVLVARAGELPRSPRASQLRASAPTIKMREVELQPLSFEESAALLCALLTPSQAAANAALRRAIVRAAAGFPMILELLVQDWETNGDRSLTLALDAMTVHFGTGESAPPIYKQVFDRLIFALDERTRHVLNVAAVLGHRLNDLSLYSIADLGQGQVMAAMTDLVRHRVLRDSGSGLEFLNEFVRAAAYLEVPSPVRHSLHSQIAGHLMEEAHRGVRFLGLEIAWHAIRAGQVAQIPTFLFKGSQEAVAQGALDSAVRALETALPHLAQEDHCAATLLLTEALQEQGRWKESLSFLLNDKEALSTAAGTVFQTLAEHRTAPPDAEALLCNVRRLLTIAESARDERVRLRAANAAAQMMSDIRSQALSRSLLSAVEAIAREELGADELHQLDLCHAQLLYHSGYYSAVRDKLTSLAESLHNEGAVGSTLARVHVGLGILRCHEGEYEAGKAELASSYLIASRIGNEAQQLYIAANLAICCHRLGEYDESLAWLRKASVAEYSRFHNLQVAYFTASAHALVGDAPRALQELNRMDSRVLADAPLWLVQAWKLFRADVLCLCDQHSAALSQAREAIECPSPVLRAPSFAGMFARWLALVSRHDGTTAIAAPILGELIERLEDFDAVDRAEIVAARMLIDRLGSPEDGEYTRSGLLEETLSRLPPAVKAQLIKLRALAR